MICLQKTIFKYHLPTQRKGLILHLKDEIGNEGWGEIAPLPGWSQESLCDAKQELLSDPKRSSLPSVMFGMESAFLQLKDPLFRELPSLPLSALIYGTHPLEPQIKRIKKLGFSCIKIKIKDLSAKRAALLIKKCQTFFENTISIRIDINRSWSLSEALHFAKTFPKETFDYLEEPLSTIKELQLFAQKTDHPIALDETFREQPLLSLPNLKAIIVKPTLQGGLSYCQALWNRLKQKKIFLILSSSYESGIGLLHIAEMIYRLNLPPLPIGLDTYSSQEDLLYHPLIIEKGHLLLPKKRWKIAKKHLLP